MSHVYLLEDDDSFRELLCTLLEEEGHTVCKLTDVADLWKQARRVSNGLAIVDGWGSSYRELSQSDRDLIQTVSAALPMILMSGRAWAASLRPDELGLAGVLAKPFNLEDLLKLVSAVDRAEARA
jgi:DNA-binding response OmpR family regulator